MQFMNIWFLVCSVTVVLPLLVGLFVCFLLFFFYVRFLLFYGTLCYTFGSCRPVHSIFSDVMEQIPNSTFSLWPIVNS